jgi:hypothetical protein
MFCASVTNDRMPPDSQGQDSIGIEMAKVRRKPSDTHHITAVHVSAAWSPR